MCLAFIVFIVLMIIYERSFSNMVTILVTVLILDALFGFYVLNSKRFMTTKMCWIFIFLLLPLVGPLLFLIFGVNPFYKKRWIVHNKEQSSFLKYENFDFSKSYLKKSTNNDHLAYNLALAHSLRPVYKYNNIESLESNMDLYEQSIMLIRKAQHHIHLQMYILADGFWLRTIVTELTKKARSGVKIRIIYDWVGSYKRLPKTIIKQLKNEGIEVAIFNPKGINPFKGATNFRGHRKVIIIDNKWSLFGGSNIGDEYLSLSSIYNSWIDFNVIVSGEVINTLNGLFCSDWLNFTNWSISKEQKLNLKNEYSQIFCNNKNGEIKKGIKNNSVAQMVESNPDYHEPLLKNLLLEIIYNAKKSIKFVTPYFMPTDDIVDSLMAASRKGIEVSLICPGKNDDKSFVQLINRNNYKKLIQTGAKAYEFDGFLHSKYIIIDNERVLTGSCNLDYRSLFLNFESCLFIESKELCAQMNNNFARTYQYSQEIDEKILKEEINKTDKLKIWLLNVVYPLL